MLGRPLVTRLAFALTLAVCALAACATGSTGRSGEAASAAYFRFWRGRKLASVGEADFLRELDRTFIPATVKTGAGRGLIAYLPALAPLSPASGSLPDEIALVVYSSQNAYHKLFATPEGTAYADLHWELFDRQQSRSLVPEVFQMTVTPGTAYDILPGFSNWQGGWVTYSIHLRKSGMKDEAYAKGVATYFESLRALKTQGLQGALVLVDPNYVIEYLDWSSAHVRAIALRSPAGRRMSEAREAALAPLVASHAAHHGPFGARLRPGRALDIEFQR